LAVSAEAIFARAQGRADGTGPGNLVTGARRRRTPRRLPGLPELNRFPNRLAESRVESLAGSHSESHCESQTRR
jgi:hypothetical protein